MNSVQANDALCPPEIRPLCSDPRVQKLVSLQNEMEHETDPERRHDRLEEQIGTIDRMFDIGSIRDTIAYIAGRNVSLGDADAARTISGVAASRCVKLFRENSSANPASDGFGVLALFALQHRLGVVRSARNSFGEYLDFVESNVPGYPGGLIIGEAGRILVEWEQFDDARAMFERARRFARQQPIRNGAVDFPRFMIFLHVIQRAAEAGFRDLAHATWDEAEDLREREHADQPDLAKLLVDMQKLFESRG